MYDTVQYGALEGMQEPTLRQEKNCGVDDCACGATHAQNVQFRGWGGNLFILWAEEWWPDVSVTNLFIAIGVIDCFWFLLRAFAMTRNDWMGVFKVNVLCVH